MADGQKPNKPLFSQHYLEHRIQECPEWQVDVRVGFEAFNTLYLSKKDLLPTLSEAQTEEVFIKPALDILGFSHIPQVTTRGKGRAERPDYALFTDEADRDAAYPLQNDEPAFYARVKAIAEAKYWERPLSKVTSNDQRDIYKNANPSFQISSYLTGTGVDWGILTNGREWRLYYRQASSTATEFYPVDLVELLESGDLEQFKYFWLFFRQAALVKDPQGRNFLERVREGSTTYAARVGNELKALVFDLVVSHTLKPILEQQQAQFGELMEQIAQLHTQLKDKRLGTQSQNGLRKDLQRLEREAQSTLLDIKVCDPAMGSGHFLVEAVDYLTDELIRILTLYPEQNPVLEMLEQTRQSILQNLDQQGITINSDRLEPTQLLQRVVMKRCIYGVDLNPMAVELAKVSLWLHSFTIGAPLSFLDHHLRCGNSLVGTTAREAEAAMSKDSGGQLALLTGPFVGLLRAAEIMRGVSVLSDATFAEVEQSESLFRSFDEAAKPYKRLLDIYVAKFFGLKRVDHFLRVFGTGAITADPKKMNKADAAVYVDAQKLSSEKRFFHWDLEFPEVFIDLENASWKEDSGFDTVIGNPPYDELSEDERSSVVNEITYFKTVPHLMQALGNRINIYRLFIAQSIYILKDKGKHGYIVPLSLLADQFTLNLRKFLLEKTEINLIEQFPQKDDTHDRIFFDAKLSTCIYVLSRKLPDANHQVFIRTHPGRTIVDNSPSYESLQANFSSFDTNNFSIPGLDKQSWDFVLRLAVDKRFCQLGDFATASPGELMINSSFKPYLKDNVSGEEAIRGSHISRYIIVEPKQGEPVFFDRDLYLADHLNSKKALAHKQKRVVYQRYAAIDNYRRLIATILPANHFCSHTTGYLSDVKDYSLDFLSALLNSVLLDWRFNLTSTNNNINGYEVEALPIPKINFTTLTDRRQQALQNTINLYQKFQENHTPDALLAQVNHHLSQQPEEADVIHDFLAYLAEQMIELNKQKQTEIKSFLQWLERFIGCPIDTLTNKSKIQNYLGNYHKKVTGSADDGNDTGEPHLGFDALIDLLKKNKKKIKIDPTARKEQQTLEKEYQASLDTLLPIKMKLMRCDRLIDQIVYKLYGLTEEEIAIVEGRHVTKEEESEQYADG